jgi:hypothetical protein
MQFFKKIFKGSTSDKAKVINPDNTKLFKLLNDYSKDNTYDNYKKAVEELTDGNAYLLLPSETSYGDKYKDWTPVDKGQTIDLGIYFVDGLKAVAAFTSEQALFTWKKGVTKYVSLPSKAIIQICETNGIDRIVVDSNLPTMIVLQRNKD